MDDGALLDLARTLSSDDDPAPLRLRKGTVVSVQTDTVTVRIGGATTNVPGVRALTTVAANDVVWLAQQGPLLLVIARATPAPDSAWRRIDALGYLNGWVNYNNSDPAWLPEYRRHPSGLVELAGLVSGGTSGASAFVLPAGYRPSRTRLFTTWAGGAPNRVDVRTDGLVVPLVQSVSGAANSYVSLSGITFMADA